MLEITNGDQFGDKFSHNRFVIFLQVPRVLNIDYRTALYRAESTGKLQEPAVLFRSMWPIVIGTVSDCFQYFFWGRLVKLVLLNHFGQTRQVDQM